VGEIGGPARSDTFQKLQRRRERVGGHPKNITDDRNCTIR
jgi:hypothetical protein